MKIPRVAMFLGLLFLTFSAYLVFRCFHIQRIFEIRSLYNTGFFCSPCQKCADYIVSVI